MSSQKPKPRLNRILGVVAFFAYLAAILLSLLPEYSLSRTGNVTLVVAFLVLLGFGQLVERFWTVYSTGTIPTPSRSGNGSNSDSGENSEDTESDGKGSTDEGKR